jgi:hypothetical protein
MPRRATLITPVGESAWAKILGEAPEPFDADGPRVWSVSLLLDPNDPATVEFIEKLEAEFAELHGGGKVKYSPHAWPFGEDTTRDEQGRKIPTGKMRINFKRKETTARGDLKSPPVVTDAKLNPWPATKLIGNGSKIRVAFQPWGWDTPTGKGMSLELLQVQVLDHVAYESAEDTPVFEKTEGFVLEEEETPVFEREPEPEVLSPSQRLRKSQEVSDEIPF